MNAIYTRRSIRKFKPAPVTNEQIESFIKAGMNAPSASDQQPWQFVVLTDRTLFPEIVKIHPHTDMLTTAPAAILVCGDLNLETNTGYWMIDCAAATENILLEIASQGLGAVWCGIYPREKRVEGIRKLLHLPEQIVPFALVPLGYPDETKPPKNLFHPERIHRNEW
jgi:nitroreductase